MELGTWNGLSVENLSNCFLVTTGDMLSGPEGMRIAQKLLMRPASDVEGDDHMHHRKPGSCGRSISASRGRDFGPLSLDGTERAPQP